MSSLAPPPSSWPWASVVCVRELKTLHHQGNLVMHHLWHLHSTIGCQCHCAKKGSKRCGQGQGHGSDEDATRTQAQTMWALVAVGKNDPSFPRPLSIRRWQYASNRTTAQNAHAQVLTEMGVSHTDSDRSSSS